jgi:hypothetical protein
LLPGPSSQPEILPLLSLRLEYEICLTVDD